jgi:hypothetical protein
VPGLGFSVNKDLPLRSITSIFVILFPSMFIYEHAVLEVLSGIKYSGVILNDYIANHKEDIENV